MKRLLRILSVMFVLISISAFADNVSFTSLNANFTIFPNEGLGDNLGGQMWGPGITLGAEGGTEYYWFNCCSPPGYAPGSSGGGGVEIFLDYIVAKIGSQSYGPNDIALGLSLNTSSFIFPTDGENFAITLPASIEGTGTLLSTCLSNPCPTFTVATKRGKLTLSFDYANGFYYGNSGSFTTTPEPATLGLVGIGIGAVVWRKYIRMRG
jgi:hypothetical protein